MKKNCNSVHVRLCVFCLFVAILFILDVRQHLSVNM